MSSLSTARGLAPKGVSGGAGRGPSGARSCMAAISSTLSIPSTTQWCSFRPIANAPCGTPGTEFSPSMTVISHGGRRRSICRRVDARDLDAQLTPVSRLRQCDVADVVFKIEVRVVHPVRHMQAAGEFGQSPPEHRRQMQTGVDLFEDSLEGDSAAGCRCGVVDQQHLNLHRGFGPFGTQHHVVGPAQLLHVPLHPPPILLYQARRVAPL